MYKQIDANKRNTWLLMIGFVVLIGGLSALFAWLLNDWTIVIWVVVASSGYAGLQYFIAGKLAMTMTGAKEIEKKDNARLYNIVENLSITAGLPMPKVYVISDPAPNAFATGRDPEHAAVAVTTGLMEVMDDAELTAVMAHEMSHVKNYDIRVSTIVFGLTCVVGLLVDFGMRLVIYGGRRDDNDSSPVAMVVMFIAAIFAPFVAQLVNLAVSRQREYLADSSAVMLTRYPEGMINALKKLDSHARPMRQQNPATEALFIADPLKKGFVNNLFSTHPSIEKRIARLENGKKSF